MLVLFDLPGLSVLSTLQAADHHQQAYTVVHPDPPHTTRSPTRVHLYKPSRPGCRRRRSGCHPRDLVCRIQPGHAPARLGHLLPAAQVQEEVAGRIFGGHVGGQRDGWCHVALYGHCGQSHGPGASRPGRHDGTGDVWIYRIGLARWPELGKFSILSAEQEIQGSYDCG